MPFPVVRSTTIILKYKLTLRKTLHNTNAEHVEQQEQLHLISVYITPRFIA